MEARKNPSGGEGSIEGSTIERCDCKQHTHLSGGRDEECNNLT
jgi:hypothetical protein